MTILSIPSIEDATITFNSADAEELRRVCAVDSTQDSAIQGILRTLINSSKYGSFLYRPILQRVLTQLYADKSPQLYLWGQQIVAAAGYPQVHVFQNGSWTLVDSTNYELIGRRILTQNIRYLSINFTNQTYYNSLNLNPDGVNPRVRVRYLTNTHSFADLPDNFKNYLFLETRARLDRVLDRPIKLDWGGINRLRRSHKHDFQRLWYPLA